MSRLLCVGDTHGAYQGLMQALEKAKFNPAEDRLISLGDTHDGWSEAHLIMGYYMGLGDNFTYLIGNHDVSFISWVDSYRALGVGVATRHSEWLKRQKYLHIEPNGAVFVHAGWHPGGDLLDPKQLQMEEYVWNRTFWQGMYEGRNYAKDHHEVFIGHTPTTFVKPFLPLPLNRRNVWNLDTGAAFMGKVTVMDTETKEYWQSETCAALYPLERGRNKFSFSSLNK